MVGFEGFAVEALAGFRPGPGDGWLAADDARLKELHAVLSPVAVRVAVLGAYARPLSATLLSGAG